MGYVFLIPGFVFLGCFLVFPFFKSLVRSFTDWNAFSPDFSFVGLKNYIELFHNDEYWAAIKVNLVFAVVSTLIQTTLGFLLAFAVYYMTPKWQQFYKVALYIPVVLPASVVAVMWKFMLNKDIGLVNTLLRLVGLDNLTHAWIGEKSTALGTVIAQLQTAILQIPCQIRPLLQQVVDGLPQRRFRRCFRLHLICP